MWREQAIKEWSRWSDLGEWPLLMLVNLVNSWLCLPTWRREWSRRVISIVACCHGAKLCAHAAGDFRSQQWPRAPRSLNPSLLRTTGIHGSLFKVRGQRTCYKTRCSQAWVDQLLYDNKSQLAVQASLYASVV